MAIGQLTRNYIYRVLSGLNPTVKGPLILCYHSIGTDRWLHTIDENAFYRQMDYLLTRIQPTTLAEISDMLSSGAHKDLENTFALTFDDGYENIMQVRDYLKDKGIKPTLFFLTNSIELSTGQLQNTLPLLSDEQIKTLLNDGWELGSHGTSHQDFWALTDKQVDHEVKDSKVALEQRFGVQINYFSYPRGRYNNNIVKTVKTNGYKLAVTMDDGFITKGTNPYLIPRVGVDKSHSMTEFEETITVPVIEFRKFVKNFAGGVIRKYI